MKKIKIAVLISGGGSNLQAIINAIKAGKINGEIKLVISDKKDVYGLERAKKEEIHNFTILQSDFSTKKQWNQAILQVLEDYKIDLVLLAGFMSILDKEIVKAFPNAIMNIHPSLIPSFCGKGYYGKKVHQAVLEYGVKLTGVSVHFVDEGADTGPIILQEAVKVKQEDTVESLAQRVLKVEHKLYPKAVQLFTQGKLKVEGRKVFILE
ncbi:phosphoribosylglycinamide formyltransferase [Garciella nitratireducens]|uniref:Phosphoribosylglycinamide formyltransferase n=1 Tax=Garciella nitratireducens DSM 15102 TaxID=1121911 RepID=A0A1T4NDY8_9FIRM|nr:phosphoribosylglycinamide formyltransferase [Garciella nitratireducens]RBP44083.1 phosphoribosylglycinamide formyltransferase-1 [Garciella nitratireducens]SJZ76988.1 formyltetrahydrofolate-dependent phosphoribosylglycinamide formyltransferase [Garciella nitratireducens DSM 15102]